MASLLSTNAADTLWALQFKLVHSEGKEPEGRSGWEPGTCCKHCGLPQSLAGVPLSCKLAVRCPLPFQMPLGQAVHTGERLTDVVLLPAVAHARESETTEPSLTREESGAPKGQLLKWCESVLLLLLTRSKGKVWG